MDCQYVYSVELDIFNCFGKLIVKIWYEIFIYPKQRSKKCWSNAQVSETISGRTTSNTGSKGCSFVRPALQKMSF
jgi:hypothetical protein